MSISDPTPESNAIKPGATDSGGATVPLSNAWLLCLALVALLLVFVDQWTKQLATANLLYGIPRVVFEPWLNWTLVHNRGAAFSFLADAGGAQHWFFVSVAVLAVVGLPVWIRKLNRSEAWLSIALMLVFSGALGNLIDRLRFRYVVDFVQVHWYDAWSYSVFNVADAAITVGAVLLIWQELRAYWRTRKGRG